MTNPARFTVDPEQRRGTRLLLRMAVRAAHSVRGERLLFSGSRAAGNQNESVRASERLLGLAVFLALK
jgi:hypothetical protein